MRTSARWAAISSICAASRWIGLEARLDRLEDTHRSVIAAAYENLSGTNQIHRAVLRMLDPRISRNSCAIWVARWPRSCASIVCGWCWNRCRSGDDPAVRKLGDVLSVAEPGFIDDYLTAGHSGQARQVTLRQVAEGDDRVYGEEAEYVRSEACLKLDFGKGRLPGMLAMGSEDPHQFSPQQGTDLLAFFTGVFERVMRRWLG
jgi:uncharacterized protein YigA (DUF484 family)